LPLQRCQRWKRASRSSTGDLVEAVRHPTHLLQTPHWFFTNPHSDSCSTESSSSQAHAAAGPFRPAAIRQLHDGQQAGRAGTGGGGMGHPRSTLRSCFSQTAGFVSVLRTRPQFAAANGRSKRVSAHSRGGAFPGVRHLVGPPPYLPSMRPHSATASYARRRRAHVAAPSRGRGARAPPVFRARARAPSRGGCSPPTTRTRQAGPRPRARGSGG
jgi:hypothetical protein